MLFLSAMLANPILTPAYAAEVEPLKWQLGDEQVVKMLLWSQLWGRVQQMNPGTLVNGRPTEVAPSFGLRRVRALFFGKLGKRLLILTHFGINNQTSNNLRKPQLFVHDAWLEGELVDRALYVGAGLHYWNGISRAANQSTLNFLTLDGPIFPWINIERTDQFARQLGIYAKGKLSKLDYRVAVNQPFVPGVEPDPTSRATQYRTTNNQWTVTGYAMVQLADEESNVVPFLSGTHLGEKTVVNVGTGAHWGPGAMGRFRADGSEVVFDQTAVGVDVFVDVPVGEGALTTYALYQHTDYGPDYVRNIGVMGMGTADPDAEATSANGPGAAYPVQGTGHTGYLAAGYLLPTVIAKHTRLQPYAAAHVAVLEGLGAPMVVAEAGANWYLAGQNAKLTAHWRSRPVFTSDGRSVGSRRHEGVVQVAFRY